MERLRATDQFRFPPQHLLHRSVPGGSINREEDLLARYCRWVDLDTTSGCGCQPVTEFDHVMETVWTMAGDDE